VKRATIIPLAWKLPFAPPVTTVPPHGTSRMITFWYCEQKPVAPPPPEALGTTTLTVCVLQDDADEPVHASTVYE
jgi:hypothetical protein